MGKIGLIANPASGKDVRRLVARASVFDNQEKRAIVRRVITGALAGGAVDFVYHNDAHGIVSQALEDVAAEVHATPVDSTQLRSALDTISAARAMRDAGCDIVITLGGDGTNRAFCLGWPDAPLLPISTGTNNVFPILQEATVAGAAAGLVASGKVSRDVLLQQKRIHIEIENERDDLALIDALLTRERFVGSRALLKPQKFSAALLTRAEPASVGITSIGGLLHPIDTQSDTGLWIDFADEAHDAKCRVHAPIAPGLYESIAIASHQPIQLDQTVRANGPGTLAFDGERERTLAPGQEARLTIKRDGPHVLDVAQTMQRAAAMGSFKH